MTIRWREVPGLAEALDAAGIRVWGQDGAYHASDEIAAQAIIDAYDPLAEMQRRRLADLAAYRYARESAGVVIDGVRWDSTREARANLQGAVALAQIAAAGGQSFTATWKGLDGAFRTLDGAALTAAAVQVGVYVAACFAREAELAAAIMSLADWQDVRDLDITTGWPE